MHALTLVPMLLCHHDREDVATQDWIHAIATMSTGCGGSRIHACHLGRVGPRFDTDRRIAKEPTLLMGKKSDCHDGFLEVFLDIFNDCRGGEEGVMQGNPRTVHIAVIDCARMRRPRAGTA